MKLETISIYQEGTGVHICIPNISVDMVKTAMTGLFLKNISETSNVQIETQDIPAKELKMDDSVNPQCTSKETESDSTANASDIPVSEMDVSSCDNAIKSASQSSDESKETSHETSCKSDNEPNDTSDNKLNNELNESSNATSNQMNEASVSEENNAESEKVTESGTLELRIVKSRLPKADKVLAGLKAVIFMQVHPDITISDDNTKIFIDLNGVSADDKKFILRAVKSTHSFED